MKTLIKTFSRQPILANFLTVLILIAGCLNWQSLNRQDLPSVHYSIVTIEIDYPSASPEEVEKATVIPIESVIHNVEGVKRIKSYAERGSGEISVYLGFNQNIEEPLEEIRQRIDALKSLPKEIESVKVSREKRYEHALFVSLTSNEKSRDTLYSVAKRVKRELLQHEFIPTGAQGFNKNKTKLSQVEVIGAGKSEYIIEISQDKLLELDMSLDALATTIKENSIDLPTGEIGGDDGTYSIRFHSKKTFLDELYEVPIVHKDLPKKLFLKDLVKSIQRVSDEGLMDIKFNGQDAVLISVSKGNGQDLIQVCHTVEDYLKEGMSWLPNHFEATVWNNQAPKVEVRLSRMIDNGFYGLILVLLTLSLFLPVRLAFYVALGIPVSIACSLCLMPFLDVTLNTVSLLGFIVVLGIIVDDAIVVGEQVYAHMERGTPSHQAAWIGTHEVSTIVIFGVLTTVIAFAAILGLEGFNGQLFKSIPVVVIVTLLCSLLQSKLLLPAQLSNLKSPSQNVFEQAVKRYNPLPQCISLFISRVYTPLLFWSLRCRYFICGLFASFLLVTLFHTLQNMDDWQFLPDFDENIIIIDVTLIDSSTRAETQKVLSQIQDIVELTDHTFHAKDGSSVISHSCVSLGAQPLSGYSTYSSNVGEIAIELVSATDRDASLAQITYFMQSHLEKLPNVNFIEFSSQADVDNSLFSVDVFAESRETLEDATSWVKQALQQEDYVLQIIDSTKGGEQEIKFVGLTSLGVQMGVSIEAVATAVRNAFQGANIYNLQKADEEIKVMLRLPLNESDTFKDLESLKFPAGKDLRLNVPVTELAYFDVIDRSSILTRVNGKPAVTLDISLKKTDESVSTLIKKIEEGVLSKVKENVKGGEYRLWGASTEESETLDSLKICFIIALLGIYMSLAVPLRSYIQPLIVMALIPFCAVGAIWGHLIMGVHLSLISLCGIVALSGIVINDSLIFIDKINSNLKAKMSLLEAILDAGRTRFRAIIFTSISTFVGVVPMIFEKNIYALHLVPIAISLGFGILFSTLLMLVFTPCLYLIVKDLRFANVSLDK